MMKIFEIRNWLAEHGFDGVIISRRDNFTWLAGPNYRNYVLSNAPVGVASLFITQQETALIADTIDGRRILEEELGSSHLRDKSSLSEELDSPDLRDKSSLSEELGSPTKLVEYPWYADADGFIQNLIGSRRIAADTDITGTFNIQSALVEMRSILNETEQNNYRSLGQKCASIVEQICFDAETGMTETQIATSIKQQCIAEGISPDCVLVGSDERIFKYRHPMPTNKVIKQKLMVVLGAERGGLNISMTRFVSFGQPSTEYLERFTQVQKIFAGMQDLTEKNISYVDFFRNVQALYAEVGYPQEWQNHHQGGPTGYACREKIINQYTPGEIELNQAFAWNPTIQGTKAEETILLNKDGLEILTRTDNWPVSKFKTHHGEITVADILVKN